MNAPNFSRPLVMAPCFRCLFRRHSTRDSRVVSTGSLFQYGMNLDMRACFQRGMSLKGSGWADHGTGEVEFQPVGGDEGRYGHIKAVLKRFACPRRHTVAHHAARIRPIDVARFQHWELHPGQLVRERKRPTVIAKSRAKPSSIVDFIWVVVRMGRYFHPIVRPSRACIHTYPCGIPRILL